MSVSKTWKIEGVDIRPSVGSLSNVVCQIQWSLTMEQRDEGNLVIARTVTNGYSFMDPPDANNFIPMESLTHDQLMAWAKDCLGEKVREYETQTFNVTVNQTSNTKTRMIFNDSGSLEVMPPVELSDHLALVGVTSDQANTANTSDSSPQ